MIDQLIADLRRDEGWSELPYRDSRGFLTIGYGFLIDDRRGSALPPEAGEIWLQDIARKRVRDLAKAWPQFADQEEEVQRALSNMAYQLGVRGLLGFKKMLLALERKDRVAAAQEALDSRWAKRQTPERAVRMAALIKGEEDVG
jgi:lysozyme